MTAPVGFGPTRRRPAPERWGATNLLATPILSRPLVVEHHYEPGGAMREHAAEEPILCVCIDGAGFVRVGDETSELRAHEAVVWPSGTTHTLWTAHRSMTVLLIHFPGVTELTPRDPGWL